MELFQNYRYLIPPAMAAATAALLDRVAGSGGQPHLRLGGNSTDESWWGETGNAAPEGTWIKIDDAYLSSLAGFLKQAHASVLFGADLGSGQNAGADALTAALSRQLGHALQGVELGNEPDSFPAHAYTKNSPTGRAIRSTPYAYSQFLSEWRKEDAYIKQSDSATAVVGPASNTAAWAEQFASDEQVPFVTWHRYGLSACGQKPGSAYYPTAARLISDAGVSAVAQQATPVVAAARSHGQKLVISESNSVACGGAVGVSDSYASALWALDDAFHLAAAGVAETDFHINSGASYSPLTFSSGAQAGPILHPEAAGLVAYGDATPAGSMFLKTRSSGPLSTWATATPDGRKRIFLINRTGQPQAAELSGLTGHSARETVLSSDALGSTNVTWGGQDLDSLLSQPTESTSVAFSTALRVDLKPYSATLVLDEPTSHKARS